jgi:hypothetical protein
MRSGRRRWADSRESECAAPDRQRRGGAACGGSARQTEHPHGAPSALWPWRAVPAAAPRPPPAAPARGEPAAVASHGKQQRAQAWTLSRCRRRGLHRGRSAHMVRLLRRTSRCAHRVAASATPPDFARAGRLDEAAEAGTADAQPAGVRPAVPVVRRGFMVHRIVLDVLDLRAHHRLRMKPSRRPAGRRPQDCARRRVPVWKKSPPVASMKAL